MVGLKMKQDNPVITLSDYQQIFRVIHSVYQKIDDSGSICCQFYNVAGALILNEVYKKKATPVLGAACFKLQASSAINLCFAHFNGRDVSSAEDAFHCWIQTEEGYLVDFTSPLFREYTEQAGNKCLIPRKMFQKNLTRMSASFDELQEEGDFFVQPNIELTQSLLTESSEYYKDSDFLNLCLHWFKKPPRKINSKLSTINENGELVILNLDTKKILGQW
jgi:hypothetical protein